MTTMQALGMLILGLAFLLAGIAAFKQQPDMSLLRAMLAIALILVGYFLVVWGATRCLLRRWR